ncbi:hypothetical protein PoB_006809800 [Plakobranchus ocellatus]|uniref:G-protein coupled receptors family 1 profile domain-containing protein n=1 Tax=Plakobranchus ocellatus TaxID=259542 RepID=A0AAV4DBE7_9GAST|nr:hypothetical protein PoB_006809800 [Plakobranchus ocellatus]
MLLRRAGQRPAYGDSLDAALVTLSRQKDFIAAPVRIHLQVEFLQGLDDYDFRESSFIDKKHPGDPLRDIYSVNEHLATLATIVANVLVLLVFFRVVGIARLSSRLLASLACANILSALVLVIHTSSVSLEFLSSSERVCR